MVRGLHAFIARRLSEIHHDGSVIGGQSVQTLNVCNIDRP
jgi:hypothetical protein